MQQEPDKNSQGIVLTSRRYRTAPCELRVREALEILEEIKNKEPQNYWTTLGQLGLADFWIYLRLILGYRHLDPWDHGEEMVWFFQQNHRSPMIFMVPRGGVKTGTITVPILPWILAKDPTAPGMITNVREEKAKWFAKQAAMIIQSPNYQLCYPWIKPSEKWGEGGYYLDATAYANYKAPGAADAGERYGGAVGRIDPNIGALGITGNITGFHGRALVHDDLISRETHDSPVQLKRAEDFFLESLNCLDPGGFLSVQCTRWRYGDLYGKIENGKFTHEGQRFRLFKRGAERIVHNDAGQPVVEIFNPLRTYVDYRGQQQKIGYSQAFLVGQKANLGSLYYALYQNEPVSDADRLIPIESVRTFEGIDFEMAPLVRMGIEVEAAATTFLEYFMEKVRDQKRTLSVDRIHAKGLTQLGQAKNARIRALIIPVVSDGRLFIRKDLWNREGNLGQEMRDFDKGEDDALDVLAMLIARAPKHRVGQFPIPYLACDPAFTDNKTSDHTAVGVGCWYGNDFFVLDMHKFRSRKPDMIANQIFTMVDRYREGKTPDRNRAATPERRFLAPGMSRSVPRQINIDWGGGVYMDNLSEGEANGSTESIVGDRRSS